MTPRPVPLLSVRHRHTVESVAIYPNGRYLAVTGVTKGIPDRAALMVWDTSSGSLKFGVQYSTHSLSARVATGGREILVRAGRSVHVLSAEIGRTKKTLFSGAEEDLISYLISGYSLWWEPEERVAEVWFDKPPTWGW